MKPWLEQLLALQAIDMRIRDAQKKAEVIPSERARIDADLAAGEKKRDAVLAAARGDEQRLKTLAGEEEAARAELQKLLIQSTQIKKAAEYTAMMNQIEEKKNAISDLETEELLQMDRIEENKAKVEEAERAFASASRNLRQEKKELEEFAAELKKRCADDAKLRALHAAKMEGPVIAAYERLLAGKKGPPVAPVSGDVCGWCSLKLTPQTLNDARRGGLVFCDNCSHIIYLPDNPA